MLLYHGTSARFLSAILKTGISPRRNKRKSNWDHGASSNPNAVYLSTAYAPYYALCTQQDKQDKLVILEVDTDKLRQSKLCPDEDFLEQATRKIDARGEKSNHPEWGGLDMHARTAAYRSVMLLEYRDKWEASVEHLGTCAYIGTIPARAITRYSTYALRSKDSVREVTHALAEPTITLANYSVMGGFYRKLTNWFFGGELTQLDVVFPCLPIEQAREAMASLGAAADRLVRTAAATNDRLHQHVGVMMYVRQRSGFKLVHAGGDAPAPTGRPQGPGD